MFSNLVIKAQDVRCEEDEVGDNVKNKCTQYFPSRNMLPQFSKPHFRPVDYYNTFYIIVQIVTPISSSKLNCHTVVVVSSKFHMSVLQLLSSLFHTCLETVAFLYDFMHVMTVLMHEGFLPYVRMIHGMCLLQTLSF